LWDGKAKRRARLALPDESAVFAEAKNNGQPSDGLMLGPSKQSRETERQRVVEEYVIDLREILKKLRKLLN